MDRWDSYRSFQVLEKNPSKCLSKYNGWGGAEMGERESATRVNHAASIPTNWTSQLKRKSGQCRDHLHVHVTVPEALPQ